MDSLHGVTTKESRTPGHYNYCRDCSCWIPIRRLVLGPVLHHRKSETPVPCSSKQWKKRLRFQPSSSGLPANSICHLLLSVLGLCGNVSSHSSPKVSLAHTSENSFHELPVHRHAHTCGSWGTTLGTRVSPTTTWVLRIVTEHSVSLRCSYRFRCHFQKLRLNSPPPPKAVLGPNQP